jgi:hypothetical protein
MIRRLSYPLSRIASRVKEIMTSLYLGIASIFIPVAMYVGIQVPPSEGRIWALVLLSLGSVSLIMALVTAQRDRKIGDTKFWT